MSKKYVRDLDCDILVTSGAYVPSEDEEYMNDRQLEYFKQKIIQLRNGILTDSIKSLDIIKEESGNLPDENDSATAESNISITLKLREQHLSLLAKIDYALTKIQSKEYGYCEDTDDEIGIRRLQVSPLAIYSVEAQERREKLSRHINDNNNVHDIED